MRLFALSHRPACFFESSCPVCIRFAESHFASFRTAHFLHKRFGSAFQDMHGRRTAGSIFFFEERPLQKLPPDKEEWGHRIELLGLIRRKFGNLPAHRLFRCCRNAMHGFENSRRHPLGIYTLIVVIVDCVLSKASNTSFI